MTPIADQFPPGVRAWDRRFGSIKDRLLWYCPNTVRGLAPATAADWLLAQECGGRHPSGDMGSVDRRKALAYLIFSQEVKVAAQLGGPNDGTSKG